jgi:hypothetical protein
MNFKTVLVSLFCGLSCGSCGARWTSLDSTGRSELEPADHGAPLVEQAHAHRDFFRDLDRVWTATVESLHAAGIAVPMSARSLEGERIIDLEVIHVDVIERAPERTCVRVYYRALNEELAELEAAALLDEIQERLR